MFKTILVAMIILLVTMIPNRAAGAWGEDETVMSRFKLITTDGDTLFGKDGRFEGGEFFGLVQDTMIECSHVDMQALYRGYGSKAGAGAGYGAAIGASLSLVMLIWQKWDARQSPYESVDTGQ